MKFNSLDFKLYFILSKFYRWYILNCSSNHFRTLRTKCELILLQENKEKTLLKIETISILICAKILHGSIPDKYANIYEEEKETIGIIVKELISNDETKVIISNYFRVLAFYYGFGIKTDFLKTKEEEYTKKSLEIDPNSTKIDTEGIKKIYSDIRKKLNTSKKELVKTKKQLVSDGICDKLPKFEILPSHITFVFSISVTVFLLSGFIYNKFFLGHFGVEVSLFFSVSDYISSSIDKIYMSLLSTILGISLYLYGMYSRIKDETIVKEYELQEKNNDIGMFINVVILSIFTVVAYYKNLPFKIDLLTLLSFIAVMLIYHVLPVDKFIKNSMHISVAAVSLIYFCSNMFWDIAKDIDVIEHKTISNSLKQKYHFVDYKISDSAVVLAANSNYFFFYDNKNKKVSIIPKDKLIYSDYKM